MRKLLLLPAILALFAATGCGPRLLSVGSREPATAPQSNPTLPAQDMVLYSSQLSRPKGLSPTTGLRTEAAAGFLTYTSVPWPGGMIPIAFQETDAAKLIEGTPEKKRSLFFELCKVWTTATHGRVGCKPRTNEAIYLQIVYKRPGLDNAVCTANVGYPKFTNNSVGEITLPIGCWPPENHEDLNRGPILHELGHAFGLMHEHQREDRDSFIKMLPDNIDPKYAYSYDLLTGNFERSGYDFNSIMHYYQYAFAKPGLVSFETQPLYSNYAEAIRNYHHALSDLDGPTLEKFYRDADKPLPRPVIDSVSAENTAGSDFTLLSFKGSFGTGSHSITLICDARVPLALLSSADSALMKVTVPATPEDRDCTINVTNDGWYSADFHFKLPGKGGPPPPPPPPPKIDGYRSLADRLAARAGTREGLNAWQWNWYYSAETGIEGPAPGYYNGIWEEPMSVDTWLSRTNGCLVTRLDLILEALNASPTGLWNFYQWNWFFANITGARPPAPEEVGYTLDPGTAVDLETWWSAMVDAGRIWEPTREVSKPGSRQH